MLVTSDLISSADYFLLPMVQKWCTVIFCADLSLRIICSSSVDLNYFYLCASKKEKKKESQEFVCLRNFFYLRVKNANVYTWWAESAVWTNAGPVSIGLFSLDWQHFFFSVVLESEKEAKLFGIVRFFNAFDHKCLQAKLFETHFEGKKKLMVFLLPKLF